MHMTQATLSHVMCGIQWTNKYLRIQDMRAVIMIQVLVEEAQAPLKPGPKNWRLMLVTVLKRTNVGTWLNLSLQPDFLSVISPLR
jgi:hypothetical protein